MYFVGIDLAWSYRNPSAAVTLRWEGTRARPVAWADALGSDEEIVGFVVEGVGSAPALVAVDAPLVVPNETGARPCDVAVSRAFRRAEAGAHPANRRRFGGVVRGEELVRRFEDAGFVHSPVVRARSPTRQVIEVYPHPAAVRLFGLRKTLKYKARPGRSYPFRWGEMSRYVELLRGLRDAEPPLHAGEILDGASPRGLRGASLKRLEDFLDALFCAYIALHCWYWGPHGYETYGSLEEGYIIVPRRVSPGPLPASGGGNRGSSGG